MCVQDVGTTFPLQVFGCEVSRLTSVRGFDAFHMARFTPETPEVTTTGSPMRSGAKADVLDCNSEQTGQIKLRLNATLLAVVRTGSIFRLPSNAIRASSCLPQTRPTRRECLMQ